MKTRTKILVGAGTVIVVLLVVLATLPFLFSDRIAARVKTEVNSALEARVDWRDAGLDTYISGEGAHHTYFDAMEFGVNVIYAGHYATETVGVKALAQHLGHRFNLPWEFHHHPTGL